MFLLCKKNTLKNKPNITLKIFTHELLSVNLFEQNLQEYFEVFGDPTAMCFFLMFLKVFFDSRFLASSLAFENSLDA